MSTAPTPANLPARAENLANQMMHGIAAVRYAASEMEVKAQQMYAFVTDITNADLIRGGFEIDDIPEYSPLQVIYDPAERDSFHCIACRGVDLTGYVSSAVEQAAMEVVHEAWMDEHDEQRRKDRDDQHKLDVQRGK